MSLNHFRKLLLLPVAIIIFGLLNASRPEEGHSKLYLTSQSLGGKQLTVPGDSPAARYQQKVDRLLRLMQQRLMVAHDVARWKWNQKRSIEDRQREQELLVKVSQQARTYGLEPDASRAFFQAQIEAGKLIQKADFQHWQGEGIKSFANVPDLNRTLRPLLDKLNTDLLSALGELNQVLGCPRVRELIQSRAQTILPGNGIDPTVQRTAVAPLLEVKETSCQGVSRLDRVSPG